jgi:hypothetical protein
MDGNYHRGHGGTRRSEEERELNRGERRGRGAQKEGENDENEHGGREGAEELGGEEEMAGEGAGWAAMLTTAVNIAVFAAF